MTVTLVLSFQLPQLIVLAKQVGIDLACLTGNILSGCLLVSQLLKHLVLFALESIELSPELLVELTLVPQVLLEVAIDNVLD